MTDFNTLLGGVILKAEARIRQGLRSKLLLRVIILIGVMKEEEFN